MPRHAAPGGLDGAAVARHLVHRQRPRDAPADEEHFVLDAEMPLGHPLFNDDPERHDVQVFMDLVHRAGPHIGHRYFGVPAERACLFYKFALRVTDPAAWRGAAHGAPLTLGLTAAPARTVSGVPRGLRLGGSLEIDGRPGCTGSADLVFITPTVARNHRAVSRLAALGARPEGHGRGTGQRPADPADVGRRDPDNVVVSAPVSYGVQLRTAVLVDPGHPVFFAEGADSVPGLLLVEALRQSALLTAGHRHGLAARRAALTCLTVHVRGHAELDLPLSCTAVAEPPGHDAEGRRCVRVHLSVEQAGKVTAQAQAVAAETG